MTVEQCPVFIRVLSGKPALKFLWSLLDNNISTRIAIKTVKTGNFELNIFFDLTRKQDVFCVYCVTMTSSSTIDKFKVYI